MVNEWFELGNLPESIAFPAADKLILIMLNDVRSEVLLRYAARDFSGELAVTYITGQDTEFFSLAYSRAEFITSLDSTFLVSKEQRAKYCSDLIEISQKHDCFFALSGKEIIPLSKKEVYSFVLSQFSEGMSAGDLVARCSGLSPCGWTVFPGFYGRCVNRLIEDEAIDVNNFGEERYARHSMDFRYSSITSWLCRKKWGPISRGCKSHINATKYYLNQLLYDKSYSLFSSSHVFTKHICQELQT